MKYEDVLAFIERKKGYLEGKDMELLSVILKDMNLREKKELVNIKERGDLEFRKGNYEEAVAIYTSYLDLDNENHIIYSNRAAAYHKLGQKEQAIKDCKEGLRLCQSFPKFYLRLGVLSLENDVGSSVLYFERGLEIDPDNEVLKEQLAIAKEKVKALNTASLREQLKTEGLEENLEELQKLIEGKDQQESEEIVKQFIERKKSV